MSKNITLTVPDETYSKMKDFQEIKWSEVARKSIEERIDLLETLEEIANKSKLTEKDVEELSTKIKKGIARRHAP